MMSFIQYGAAQRSVRGLILPLVALLATPAATFAQPAETVSWRNAVEVRQELEGIIRLTWPSNPLRDSLDNLARARRVAIWLDRRIDPDQRVEFKTDNVPFREALRLLAEQLQGRVCLVGSVLYIGPRESASKLYTLSAKRREEAGKLPLEARRKLGHAQPWRWEELTEPRELIAQLATEGEVKIEGVDRVAHDLWAARDWPALTVVDRLSLVLAGFDQTFEYSADGSTLTLAPFPASTAVEQTYSVKGDVAKFAERLAELFPKAKISTGVGKVIVTAEGDEHEQIARIVKGEPVKRPPVVGGEVRYTLKIENQAVGAAAKSLAGRVELEIKFDPSIDAEKLNERVSFQVKEATLNGLFEALLKPAGLRHKITGKTIEVSNR